MKMILSVAAALMLAGPVMAQGAAADPAPAPAGKLDKRDPNAVRCRSISEIGSLVKKQRICKTNAEWTRSREQQQRDADDFITRNRSGMNPNG